MTFVKINDTLYPATITGKFKDRDWDGRESQSILLEMEHAEAKELFTDGVAWSVVTRFENPTFAPDEHGIVVQTGTEIQETEQDCSEYDLAGDLIDHRNGKITVKMGKHTAEELLAVIMGGR